LTKTTVTPSILINADDYGMHPDINAGIRHCVEHALIDTVSIAPCGEALDGQEVSSLQALIARASTNIGVHLMLTEGRPFSGVSSFTQKDGSFLLYINDFVRRYLTGHIKLRDIEQEWDIQIRWLIDLGFTPVYLNGHQHVHLLPGLWQIAVKLAKQYKIPRIRNCYQSIRDSLAYSPRHFVYQCFAYLRYLGASSPRMRTVGTLFSCNLALERIQPYVEWAIQHSLPLEVASHPGFESPSLFQRFGYWNAHWKQEINELEKLKALINGLTGDRSAHNTTISLYAGAPPMTKWFINTRAKLCPFPFIESLCSDARSVLDVGCGLGFLTLYAASAKKERKCVGIDTEKRLIDRAATIAAPLKNVSLLHSTLEQFASSTTDRFEAITFIDVLYLLPENQQEQLLRIAAGLLTENGKLIIKETHKSSGIRYLAAYAEECLVVSLKRRRPSFSFHYRAKEEWESLLNQLGFKQQTIFRTPYEKPNNFSYIFCGSR
jgi:chitin disaccharide deacetylase